MSWHVLIHTRSSAVAERPRVLRVSLNISLSHSRSLDVIRNGTLESGVCKFLLVFSCDYMCLYLVPFLRYSASNFGVTLKSGLEVTQVHWKWRHSIDHYTTYYQTATVTIALSCIISEIKQDGAPVTGIPVGISPYRLVRKTRMVWLSDSEKSLMIYLAVSIKCDTSMWHTDGHLATAQSARCAQHRAVKSVKARNLT